MRFIIYDFPDEARTTAFARDLYQICVDLGRAYSHIIDNKLIIDMELHTGSPQTMVVLCKKPQGPATPQMLNGEEVMLTLGIAAAIEEIAERHGIEVPDTEPVMQIH
jgi:hypothetical protein